MISKEEAHPSQKLTSFIPAVHLLADYTVSEKNSVLRGEKYEQSSCVFNIKDTDNKIIGIKTTV
ncbi:hypothetical protein [Chryseobacterium sp. MEBOG07]|uniref:hypothetical protein n=1 Tax=Chryseobacterium sp. MEBOG07 TaxID=2879939 RepID=UPI001F45D759|nr:hypothetical protein [Chryseobacterium sp. MEBOG07]UKB78152.1 hypothetical protein LF886_16925 [Chryseobacterium sp. MEBOG07]